MSVGQYRDVEYAEHLRDLLVGDLDEINYAIADEPLQPLVDRDIVVAPPGVQISDAMIFVTPADRRYPESPTQAEHNVEGGVKYVTWARHVAAALTVQPQVVMVEDARSVAAATRAVCRLSEALDRLFLRYIKLEDWWAWLDVQGVSSVLALRMPGTAETLVAARQFALEVRVKERVDTRPVV